MQKKRNIKKAVAKKVITEKKFTISIEVIDWSKVPSGTYFKAKYYSKPIMGRIYKANNAIYLCQNNEGGGANLPSSFKLKFSKYLCGVRDLIHNGGYFKEIKLLPKRPDNFKDIEIVKMEIASRTATICKGYVNVGCQRVPNDKIRKLYSLLKD